jgi:hypothetical protein
MSLPASILRRAVMAAKLMEVNMLNVSAGRLATLSAVLSIGCAFSAYGQTTPETVPTPELFGAKGDGTSDDTAAINAFVASIRSRSHSAPGSSLANFGQGRVYITSGPLNFTGLSNVIIDLNGSVIKNADGNDAYAVVDMLGSSATTLENGSIYCGKASSPCVNGLQFGVYTDGQGYGAMILSNLKIDGYYSQAAVYNSDSETLSAYSPYFSNRYSGHDPSYVLIQDGTHHWPLDSNFLKVNLSRDSLTSFNENSFYTPIFFNHGYGPAVWMSGANRHSYDRGYIQVQDDSPAAVLFFSKPSPSMSGLNWSIHSEVSPSSTFFISGENPTPSLTGLTILDNLLQTKGGGYVFQADSKISRVTLNYVNIDLPKINKATTKVFDQPNIYNVTGTAFIPSRNGGSWNGPKFNGTIYTDDARKFLAVSGKPSSGPYYTLADPTHEERGEAGGGGCSR